MKKTLIVLLVFFNIFVLQSCSNQQQFRAHLGNINEVMKLTLADASQPVFALIYIAQVNGYFSDVGLEMDYLKFTSGRDALNSVLRGDADVATVFETPVVIKAFEKQPLRILSSLHQSDRNTALVVRRDRGIESVKDLVGKNIGVPFNTNAQFFLNQLLKSAGIKLNQVKFFNIQPQNISSRFMDGSMDAVAIWNPNLHKTKVSLPKEQIKTIYSDLYTERSMLVTLAEHIKTSRLAYVRFLTAIKRAEQFLIQQPKKSLEITIHSLSDLFDEGVIASIWEDFLIEATLSRSLLGLLDSEAIWMKQTGFKKGVLPNFEQLVEASLLKEVDESSVTLIEY